MLPMEREISTNESLTSIDRVDASQPAIAAERRAIESALRDSEERFRAVWEATSEAMALSDPDGVVIAVNLAYCALYGLIPQQVIGQSFAVIFPEEARAAAVEQYRAILADPDPPPSYESRVQHADGSERFVEARADFLARDGERVAMISSIRDITERKRAERVQQDFIAMASWPCAGNRSISARSCTRRSPARGPREPDMHYASRRRRLRSSASGIGIG